MKLRKGVKFHDGETFNAHAVKYQMEWIKDPKSGCWSRTWIEPLKSVEVVDEYTIRWHFTKTWSAFLDIIANVPGWMISPKALRGDVALRELDDFEEMMDDAEEEMDEAEGAARKAGCIRYDYKRYLDNTPKR